MSKRITPRTLAVLAEIRETTDTFQAIAARHGLTRERVRQIALIDGIKGRRIPKLKRYRRISCNWFTHLVRKHLAEIGHGYCCVCHAAKPCAEMVTGHNKHCKQCAAIRTKGWRSKPGNRARSIAWKKANADKQREYQRRYNQKRRAQQ